MSVVINSLIGAPRSGGLRALVSLLALSSLSGWPQARAAGVDPAPADSPATTNAEITGPSSVATPPATPPTSPTGPGTPPKDLSTVTVQAPEPRFVAPTRRDRIGRIWAPVFINGKGPFRLSLDSCADTSGITKRVALALGLSADGTHRVLLHGGIGTATVPIVPISSFNVGDLSLGHTQLPIVPDALGGADGILGTSRMAGRRIMIDFRHDLITITRSHREAAPAGYLTIPFKLIRPELIMVDAYVGNVRAKAIIDTGGEGSIANMALRNALERKRVEQNKEANRIQDVTKATMAADSADSPPILIAAPEIKKQIQISNDRLTFADMRIFDRWQLRGEPTVLIGMNTLGQFDVLIIDYQRKELQIRMHGA